MNILLSQFALGGGLDRPRRSGSPLRGERIAFIQRFVGKIVRFYLDSSQYGLGGVIWRSVVSAGGRSVEAEFLADVVDAVEPLPGEQLYGAAETVVARSEGFGDGAGLLTHVAVGGCLAVYRVA